MQPNQERSQIKTFIDKDAVFEFITQATRTSPDMNEKKGGLRED
jgi:hypothetical protein